MAIDCKAVGHRIRHARESRGWAQNELSRRAGVSAGYVSRLEDGYYKRPSAERLDAIARALALRVSDLTHEPAAVDADTLSAHIRTAFGNDARKIEDFFLQAKDLDHPDLEFVLATVEWLRARLDSGRAVEHRRAVLSGS